MEGFSELAAERNNEYFAQEVIKKIWTHDSTTTVNNFIKLIKYDVYFFSYAHLPEMN